jgi:hypothetical protein
MSKRDWNQTRDKFLLYVVQATGLPTKDTNSVYDVYARVKIKRNDKKQREFRTRTVKKELNPSFCQFYFLDTVPTEVCVQLYKDTYTSADFLGKCSCNDFDDSPKEIVVEKWLPLEDKKKKSTKRTITGQLQIRFVISQIPDKAVLLTEPEPVLYFHHHYTHAFKSGDLLLYSGVGLIPNLIKLRSATPFSHLGIILKLNNKWSKEEELYIVEATSNPDNYIDAFKEVKRPGINIFRFYERLHQFHGTGIWWSALKQPPDPKKLIEAIQWIWKEYKKEEIDLKSVYASCNDSMQLLMDEFQIDYKKNYAPLFDLWSTELVARFYKACGLVPETVDVTTVTPLEVVNFTCLCPPVLLRTSERTKNEYLRTQAAQVPPVVVLQGPPETQYFGRTSSLTATPSTLSPTPQPVVVPLVSPLQPIPPNVAGPMPIPMTPNAALSPFTPPNPFTPPPTPSTASSSPVVAPSEVPPKEAAKEPPPLERGRSQVVYVPVNGNQTIPVEVPAAAATTPLNSSPVVVVVQTSSTPSLSDGSSPRTKAVKSSKSPVETTIKKSNSSRSNENDSIASATKSSSYTAHRANSIAGTRVSREKREERRDERPERREPRERREERREERRDERQDERSERRDERSERRDERSERRDERSERRDERSERRDERSERQDERPERRDERSERRDERSERRDERSERRDERSERRDERPERRDERSERRDERSERRDERSERREPRERREERRDERSERREERRDERSERRETRERRDDRRETRERREERRGERSEIRESRENRNERREFSEPRERSRTVDATLPGKEQKMPPNPPRPSIVGTPAFEVIDMEEEKREKTVEKTEEDEETPPPPGPIIVQKEIVHVVQPTPEVVPPNIQINLNLSDIMKEKQKEQEKEKEKNEEPPPPPKATSDEQIDKERLQFKPSGTVGAKIEALRQVLLQQALIDHEKGKLQLKPSLKDTTGTDNSNPKNQQ